MSDWRKYELAHAGTPVVSRSRPEAAPPSDAAEMAALRSINARLLREIAALKEREAHALRLADRDGLTGLYNRRRMSELVGVAIGEAERHGHQLGMLFLDLDGFKRINDRHGHAAGDELLTVVAGRVAARARSGDDVVCRYGGDEFLVVLPRIPGREAALEVAATLAARVALPCRVAGEELRVTAAIGVSVFPEDGRSAAELLERADAEMYRMKGAAPDEAAVTTTVLRRRRDDRSDC